jgi:hypothetical protein
MIGPVLDASGVAVTDCVVADFEGSVNGGDPAALNGSATLTHRGVGFYSLALTATDLATVGSFEVTINDTTNSCGMKELTVIEEAIYDALFAASANGFAGAAGSSTVTFSNTTIGTATNVTTVNGLAANVITAAATAADFGTEVGTAVWATAARTLTAATNITSSGSALTMTTGGYVRADLSSLANENELISTAASGNFSSFFDNASAPAAITLGDVATAAALATVDSEIGVIDGIVDTLTSDMAKVPKSDGTVAWNATAAAQIQSECNDALVGNHLDHLFQTTYDPASKPGVADALLNELVENDGGVARYTANALEQAPTGGSAPTVGQIADEVQTRTIAGVTLVTTTTNLTNLPTIPANWLTAAGTAADFTTEIQSGLATAASIAALNNLSAAQVNAEVDTALADYDPPTRAELTTDTNSVLTAVGDVPTNAELTAALASADDAVLAAIAALNNVSNASVATAVLTTAMTEAYRSTGGTGTVAQLLYEIIAHLGESSISGTTKTLKKLDGSTTAKTYTLNDATTPTAITETT